MLSLRQNWSGGRISQSARLGAAAAAATAVHVLLALPACAAVFGVDDRAALPSGLKSLEAKVGLLVDRRSHAVCTAFCVAPDIVATAGHCLYRTRGEARPRLSDFTFALPADGGQTRVRIKGAASGQAAQNVVAGTEGLSVKPPIEAARDWALVRLEKPHCRAGGLSIRQEALATSDADRIYQVGFHRDIARWRLTLGGACRNPVSAAQPADLPPRLYRDFVEPEHVLLHGCDTAGASSGSPLIIDGPAGPEVAAINVGTYVTQRTLVRNGAVVHRYKSLSLANTAVKAAAFAPALRAFRESRIAESEDDIRRLQERLRQAGFYAGASDGRYGPAMKAALKGLEAREGRPPLGLATEDAEARAAAFIEGPGGVLARGVRAVPVLETGSLSSDRVAPIQDTDKP